MSEVLHSLSVNTQDRSVCIIFPPCRGQSTLHALSWRSDGCSWSLSVSPSRRPHQPHQCARHQTHPSRMRYGPPEKLREILAHTTMKHLPYWNVGTLVPLLKHAVIALYFVPGICLCLVRDPNIRCHSISCTDPVRYSSVICSRDATS